jgi:uncharacterized protein (TIRG00374 family)
MNWPTAGSLARICASLLLLWGILDQVGVQAATAQIGDMSPGLVALALVLLVAESLLRSFNWTQLIRGQSRLVPLRTVVYAYFVGGFFGAVMPSSFGTDVARSAVASARAGVPFEQCLATTLLLNLLSLLVVSTIGLLACAVVAVWPATPLGVTAASAAAAVACLAGLGALQALTRLATPTSVDALPRSSRWSVRLRAFLSRFLGALALAPRNRRLASISMVAACSYALRSAGWLTLLSAAGASLAWPVLLAIGPLVVLSALLPISFLGFGGFQAVAVWLLTLWNVPGHQAVAAFLVQSILGLVVYCIGCAVYLAGGRMKPSLVVARAHDLRRGGGDESSPGPHSKRNGARR